MPIKDSGLKRIWNALGYSLKGLTYAIRNEAAFRQELLGAAVLIPLGLWLGESGLERALLVLVVLLVLLVELMNSALEAIVDRIGEERSSLSGAAKDMGSAAVFLSLVMVLVVWGLVLLG